MANFCLEDIDESVPGYGNPDQAYTERYIGDCNIQNCFIHSNDLLWSDN